MTGSLLLGQTMEPGIHDGLTIDRSWLTTGLYPWIAVNRDGEQ
jgi:hypothetical protein